MIRVTCSLMAGLLVAFGLASSPSSAADSGAAETGADTAARTCYYACDTWTLYPTFDACQAACPDPCERVCF